VTRKVLIVWIVEVSSALPLRSLRLCGLRRFCGSIHRSGAEDAEAAQR